MARRLEPKVTRLGVTENGTLWRLGAPEAGQVAEPEQMRRSEPQAEEDGRAPLCPACLHLEDAVGHVWACGRVAVAGRRGLLTDAEEAS
jgi:hypothetical protein